MVSNSMPASTFPVSPSVQHQGLVIAMGLALLLAGLATSLCWVVEKNCVCVCTYVCIVCVCTHTCWPFFKCWGETFWIHSQCGLGLDLLGRFYQKNRIIRCHCWMGQLIVRLRTPRPWTKWMSKYLGVPDPGPELRHPDSCSKAFKLYQMSTYVIDPTFWLWKQFGILTPICVDLLHSQETRVHIG